MKANGLRRVAPILAMVAAALTTSSTAPGVAAADEPTVTVTPQAVADGTAVTITTTGIDGEIDFYGYFQCPASVVGSTDESAYGRDCRSFLVGHGPFETTVTGTVARHIGTLHPQIDCATVAGGCVVGVHALFSDGTSSAWWTPITFEPDADATPRVNLADGDAITVTGRGLAGGGATVAQCSATYARNTGIVDRDMACSPAVPLTDAGTDGTATVVVHDPMTSERGFTGGCGYRDCALVVATPDAPVHVALPISFGPPSLAVPAGPHADGATVAVGLDGIAADEVRVRQCGTGGTICADSTDVLLDATGSADVERTVRRTLTYGDETVDCSAEPCSLVAEVDGVVVASAPIAALGPLTLAVAPDIDVLDGQEVTVTITGAPATSSVPLYRCAGEDGSDCVGVGLAMTDATGTASVTTAVARRPDDATICREQCGFKVVASETLVATFAMATGSLDATPTAGLGDGDTVIVTGTDLMPSYAGRPIGPFPTGGWMLTQCDADVADAPTLWAAFDGCAVPPSSRAVDVPGSTLDASIDVRVSITTFLGRSVGCTEPSGCVVGLFRFEQDGSATFLSVPIVVDG